jgi:hypothetical protein
MKKNEFNMNKYELMKAVFKDYGYTNEDIESYILTKKIRHQRYQQLNNYTDEEIIAIVNEYPTKQLLKVDTLF